MIDPGDRAKIGTAILRQHGRILPCHRSPQRLRYPNVWAFPGGHVEAGEAAGQALVRELDRLEDQGLIEAYTRSVSGCNKVAYRITEREEAGPACLTWKASRSACGELEIVDDPVHHLDRIFPSNR